jgi:hypothetical protein
MTIEFKPHPSKSDVHFVHAQGAYWGKLYRHKDGERSTWCLIDAATHTRRDLVILTAAFLPQLDQYLMLDRYEPAEFEQVKLMAIKIVEFAIQERFSV